MPDPVEAGQQALRAADWRAARTLFGRALEQADRPEARDGLGLALWWLNQVAASHEQRALAYAAFKRDGDLATAARIAAWLAREQIFLHASASGMNGWFARAERLLSELGPCRERGWYLIYRASLLSPPEETLRVVDQILAIARVFRDADLEAFALAYAGSAQIALGRVANGMTALDEAMAMATGGEVDDYHVVSEIFCVMLSACELAGDLERADHWCRTGAEYAARRHCPFLAAYCRTTYGGLLATAGRWPAAEEELLGAIHAFEQGHRALKVHATIKLADLRVSQGRLEEAAALLAGYEDHGAAAVPLARLHLARHEIDLARAVLAGALATSDPPTLHRAPLLLTLVDALLAAGDLTGASDAAAELALLAQQSGSDLLLAQAELAEGNIRRAAGDADASAHFQAALARLRAHQQSLLAGRARLGIARNLVDTDRAGAITWAQAALATFERLGAASDANEASELLRRLGATGRSAPRLAGNLTAREQEVLDLIGCGLSNREIAERLFITPKTAEHHVSQILGKLGARTRSEAVALALNQGERVAEPAPRPER
jgi:DNA-binding NarL/FixJ family response regulator